MQEKTRKLGENARKIGLKINAKKTKLMYLNTERLPVIFVNGKQLDTVDSFNYIGSCITTEDGKPPSSSLNLQIEEEHIDNFNNETLSLKLPMQGV
jgi:hypothetical protein